MIFMTIIVLLIMKRKMIVKMIKIMIMMMITPGEDRYQYRLYIY